MRVPRLGEADRRAVDMLLDQLPNVSSSAAAGFTAVSSLTSDPKLVEAVRTALSPLDHYEVEEPPADLASRTLALVARHPIVGAGTVHPVETQNQPLNVRPDVLHS